MLRIAQISDPHLGQANEIYLGLDNRQRFLNALNAARTHQPDAYFFMGDYSLHDPDLAVCKWMQEQIVDLDAPAFFLAGNHDDANLLKQAFPSLKELASNQTLDYTFRLSELDFIVIDTSQKILTKNQLIWLAKALQEAHNPVLLIHHPPLPLGIPFMDKKHLLQNHDEVLQLLLSYENTLQIFCGHCHSSVTRVHQNLRVNVAPPTSFYINPIASVFVQDDLPPAYQILSYKAGEFTIEPHYVS